mgnify:CR=1 FL=1
MDSNAGDGRMIDTDKYEGTNWDLKGQFTHTEMADEVLLLLAEVKRLRRVIEQHGIDISFDPKHNEEDEVTLYEWLDATSQGYWGSVYEYKVMKQEESE